MPSYCIDEVAEHVIALLFSMARGIQHYDRAVHEGNWSLQTGRPVVRIRGRTLGILGLGQIGRALLSRARGLGLEVIAHDPFREDAAVVEAGAQPVSLLDLAQHADFVSVHTPLSKETAGLVSREFLAAMKSSAYLINAARGAIVDQDALLSALTAGRIAGAALDVFVPETLDADHPLLRERRLLATPHVAFYSEQSVADLARLAAENVATVLHGGRPDTVVNPEVYDRAGDRA